MTISARNQKTGSQLAETVTRHTGQKVCYTDQQIPDCYDLLVNCTPVGMTPHVDASPARPELLEQIPVVFDTIYSPSQTKLLFDAQQFGAHTINGLYMLIYQALRAQEIWLDLTFTDDEVREIAAHVQAELNWREQI